MAKGTQKGRRCTAWEQWRKISLPVGRPLFLYLHTKAGQSMSKDLSRYIKPGSKVLDLGCGTGAVGQALAEQLQVNVVGTDVRDVRIVDLPFKRTNGKTLPFPDKTFDIVLIAYVLHHTSNRASILKEAIRVCKGNILIYEDTPQNFFHAISCAIHGFSYGSLFGIEKRCTFLTREEWAQMFTRLGLKILNSNKIDLFNPIHTTSRTFFVLATR